MRLITALLYAAGMPERIPLFPLNTPLVPGLVLPLHIFEPRYRALVRELLDIEDEDRREFGIVAVRDGRAIERDGREALYEVGVTALLRQAEPHEDGRYDIVTMGHRRFLLTDIDVSEPLIRADVEFLAEATGPHDATLAHQVMHRFRDYRAALSGQVQATVEDDDVPEDPVVLSYLVTAAMLLPVDERQSLLAAPSTAARLALARDILARETLLISELGAVPSLEIPGTTPSIN